MAAELARLVESGTIRVLDLLIVQEADDGTVEALEIDDLDDDEDAADELRGLETEIAEVLAAEDVVHLAEAMENGTRPASSSGRTPAVLPGSIAAARCSTSSSGVTSASDSSSTPSSPRSSKLASLDVAALVLFKDHEVQGSDRVASTRGASSLGGRHASSTLGDAHSPLDGNSAW
jgi:hypothetical protein